MTIKSIIKSLFTSSKVKAGPPSAVVAATPLLTNEAGIALIKKFEGLVLTAYPDPASELGQKVTAANYKITAYNHLARWEDYEGGPWSLGYGETKGISQGMTWTAKQAEDALRNRLLNEFEPTVTRTLEECMIGKISSNQFSALVSFCYNCGGRNLKKLLSEGLGRVPERLLSFNKANGIILPGLVRRRESEKELFLTKDTK